MKFFLLLAGLSTVSPIIAAETPTPAEAVAPVKSERDLAHDAVWAIYKEAPPSPNLLKEKPRDYFLWQGDKNRRFAEAAQAFAVKYPTDPRRWEALVQSSYVRPLFITGFKADFDEKPSWSGLVEDQTKIDAFQAGQAKRFAELQASTDATPRQRGGAYYALIVEAKARFARDPSPENKAAYLADVDEFIQKIPDALATIAQQHIGFLKSNGTKDELAAFTAKIESSKDPAMQQMLAEGRGDFKRFDGISELTFTAADGREVALEKLRGKVVLIDFWATWCGPCKEEIPNVVANYQKYHDKGFEVVGISLENPATKPNATAEETTAKLATAKKKMLDFTEAHQMPWPQQFDGKWWKNDIATRFGINAIPAMVLLDQNGKVVSIEARGPELEIELRKLLRL